MGLAERIPYPLFPDGDSTDPEQAGQSRWATQPPIGCRYYYSGSTLQTLTANTHSTLDFRTDAGNIQYDPYDMIDVTNDTITIPQPGIWDMSFVVLVVSAAAASDSVYAQFSQGTANVNTNLESADVCFVAAAGDYIILKATEQLYIPASVLGAGRFFRMRGYSGGSNNDFKITTFSMWLRSAVIPSKF